MGIPSVLDVPSPPVTDPGASLIDGDTSDAAAAASAMVRGYCGWHIAVEIQATAQVPLTGYTLFLPTLLLTSVVSVTTNPWRDSTDAPVALDVADWFDDGRVLLDPCQWWSGRSASVEVVFTHGYSTVPADVSAAVKSFAARQASGVVTGLREQVRQGSTSVTYARLAQAAAYTPVEMWTLDRYRLPKIA